MVKHYADNENMTIELTSWHLVWFRSGAVLTSRKRGVLFRDCLLSRVSVVNCLLIRDLFFMVRSNTLKTAPGSDNLNDITGCFLTLLTFSVARSWIVSRIFEVSKNYFRLIYLRWPRKVKGTGTEILIAPRDTDMNRGTKDQFHAFHWPLHEALLGLRAVG